VHVGLSSYNLSKNAPNTRKLEAWAVRLHINGTVNNGGNLNIKYTASAYDKVYSAEMLGWSGCAVIQAGRTNRYGLIEADHKLMNFRGKRLSQITNALVVRYGCLGDA